MAQSGYSAFYQQPAYSYPPQIPPTVPTQAYGQPVQSQYSAPYQQPLSQPAPQPQSHPYGYSAPTIQRPPSRINPSPMPSIPVGPPSPQHQGYNFRPPPSPQFFHAPPSNPYPSPVSPQTPSTGSSQLARRPLPTPRGLPPPPQSAGVPQHAPQPPSSPQPGYVSHRPHQSVPSIFPATYPPPNHGGYPAMAPEPSVSPTSAVSSATSTSPPRPLPLPRSAGNFDLASAQQGLPRPQSPPKRALPEPQPSPTRQDSSIGSPEPLSASGQKFVPLWKRQLPQPGAPASRMLPSPTESRQQGFVERRSTVSSGTSRPLPPSPGKASSSSAVGLPRDPFAQAGTLPPHLQLPNLPPTPQSPEGQSANRASPAASPTAGSPNFSASPSSSRFALRERSRTLPLPSAAPTYPLPSKPDPPSPRRPQNVTDRPFLQSPQSSDDEELTNALLERHPRSPSPQYGIRDLPRNNQVQSGVPGSPTKANDGEGPSRVRRELPSPESTSPNKSATHLLSGDSDTSLAFRMAATSLQSPSPTSPSAQPPRSGHGYSSSVSSAGSSRPMPQPPSRTQSEHDRQQQPSQSPQRSAWPSTLPPLPRAPASPQSQSGSQSGFASQTQVQARLRPLPIRSNTVSADVTPFGRPRSPRKPDLDLSLDDAPPPSLRRSPAPSHNASPQLSQTGNRAGTAPSGVQLQRAPSQDTTASVFSLSSFPKPPTHVDSKSPSPTKFAFRPTSPAKQQPHDFGSRSQSPTKTQTAVRSPSPTKYNGPPAFAVSEQRSSQPTPRIPKISFPANPDGDSDEEDASGGPVISVSGPSESRAGGAPNLPRISFGIDEGEDRDNGLPSINIGGAEDVALPKISLPGEPSSPGRNRREQPQTRKVEQTLANPRLEAAKRSGLVCGGCGGAIIGRIVSAMDMRWHPGCFRCCVCDELLENLSSYAHEGRPYCHLDYHERFAPRCYHCQTPIVDERFITLDDPELGKRTYHEQHFFCAECGDPFLPPSTPGAPSRTFAGDGEFAVGAEDDVGFTVYKGHPYCEACHVRLRMPKCKKCKKSIRHGMQAVEALGGKWCWECFTCASCDKPFEVPAFFQRDGKPFCEHCFSIMIRNEI
ncbi:hypothetical protein BD414DRAFT_580425 [Trametes punicea]|nr:hypothetical protein BD414DRAFT_580425 [Trametes punicea]